MTDEMMLSGTLTVLFKVVIPYHVYNTLNIEHKKWKKFHSYPGTFTIHNYIKNKRACRKI